MKQEVAAQTIPIPFLGDLHNVETGQFVGTCISDKLVVSDLSVNDNLFEITVALGGHINRAQLDNSDATHVVIGIDVELPSENAKPPMPVLLSADILKNREEMVKFSLNFVVEPGSVKIIQYRLVPIEYLKIMGSAGSATARFNIALFQSVEAFKALALLRDQAEELSSPATGLSAQDRGLVKEVINEASAYQENVHIKAFTYLQDFSSATWVYCLVSFIYAINESEAMVAEMKKKLAGAESDRENKSVFIQSLIKKGIKYVNSGELLRSLMYNRQRDAYIIFFGKAFSEANATKFTTTFRFFYELKEGCTKDARHMNNLDFAAVDLDVLTKQELGMSPPMSITVRHFGKGKCLSYNLMKDIKNNSLNVARYPDKREESVEPKRRGKLLIPCPNSFGGCCSHEVVEWVCDECKNFLDYGFDSKLYCDCGAADLKRYLFKCADYKHGPEFVQFVRDCEIFFDKIVPMSELNILILGQSGVGKSTWINGIVNYMMYETIGIAQNSEILSPIPTKFTVTDDNFQTREIICGEDENEDKTVGASATQDCRTYTLRYKNYYVKLIDTPGMGDSRGIEQDRKNVKKILDHIRHFDLLHGLCILLKPNESRIGVLLKFCVKEILTHLHKNCSKNIVYCFTNARSTFYKPGDTLPVLEKLLDDINVRNTLQKDRIYCLDNESYRYLCTLRMNSISYTQDDHKSFSMSWDKSVMETKRLLDHVSCLEPHRTHETLSLNQAKSIILSLTKPIAEITHNIELNLASVRDHKALIENWNKSEKELLDNLYIPQVTVEPIPLNHPRTVCVNKTCVTFHKMKDSNTTIIEYVTHCHPHCYLQGVQPEVYPNPDLKNCAAMHGTMNCLGCKCPWSKHMHIYYDQRRTEIKVKDTAVETQIGTQADAKKQKENIVRGMENQIKTLDNEKKKIISVTVKFGHFLKRNAITPYNDAFGDYLKYLIDQENSKPQKTENDRAILAELRRTNSAYEEEVQILEEAMRGDTNVTSFTPADVKQWEKELYALPIHGEQLRRAMAVTVAAEDNASRYGQKNISAKKTNNGGIMQSLASGVKNMLGFGRGKQNQNNGWNDSQGNQAQGYSQGYQAQGYSQGYGHGAQGYSSPWSNRPNDNYGFNSANNYDNDNNKGKKKWRGKGRGKR